MRISFLLAVLLFGCRVFAQCPFSASISTSGICLGDTLTATTGSTLSEIAWYRGTKLAGAASATGVSSSGVVVAGGHGSGSDPTQVSFPVNIFVDPVGNLYIADASNARAEEWGPGATLGTIVAGGYGPGSAAYQLNQPNGVCVDGAGNVYVSDSKNNRVQKWAPGATNGVTVAGGNGMGGAANQLNDNTGICLDAAGNLYVADLGNERVQKWAPGATSGVTVAGGNGGGTAANQCFAIWVFVDAASDVYVTDGANERIQEWLPGATSGYTVAGGNGEGSAANQFISPDGIFVDNIGDVFVADYGNNRIQEWAPGATSGVTVAGGEGAGSATNQINGPGTVYMDAAGDLYVGDVLNNRVMKYPEVYAPVPLTYVPDSAGTYTAVLTDKFGCKVTTNALVVKPTLVPSVLLTASDTAICQGGTISFTAMPANGGPTPVYQWSVNGGNTGSNSTLFSSSALNTGDVVTCAMTSSVTCPSPASVSSNSIMPTVNPVLTPSVTIATVTTTVCAGAPVTFQADPVNGGNTPLYQWAVDGANEGPASAAFTSSVLGNGDVITCVMKSSVACPSIAAVLSNYISMAVKAVPNPTVVIAASATTLCSGDTANFNASVTNQGTGPDYQWQINGVNTGTNSPLYRSANLANGDTVSCLFTNNAGCEDASNSIAMTVGTTPKMGPSHTIKLTNGQGVVLNLDVSGDFSSCQWTPPVSLSNDALLEPTADPKVNTQYTLTVASAQGCSATGFINVEVYNILAIPGGFSPNGDGINDIFYILSGPSGSRVEDFAVFNRWGQKIFHVSDVLPGDPSYGWNGLYRTMPAPVGAYVYKVSITFANGVRQSFEGTVMLTR